MSARSNARRRRVPDGCLGAWGSGKQLVADVLCGCKSARSPPPSRPPGTSSARPSTRPTLDRAAVALERAEKAISDLDVEIRIARGPARVRDAATHWSTRTLGRAESIGKSTVQRWCALFGVKPHLAKTFKLSTDPFFIEKVRDIVGYDASATPFAWVATAQSIIDKVARIATRISGTAR